MRIENNSENELPKLSAQTEQGEDIRETHDPKYPCEGCKSENACYQFRTCRPYLSWFRIQWRGIREVAKQLKKN